MAGSEFVSAPEADLRWPGRRKLGAAFLIDPDNNRWDVVRSTLEGQFERVEGYRRTGMRVSTDKTDPGYVSVASLFQVRHDGKVIDNWVTADTGEGRLVCYGVKGGPTVITRGDPTRALTYEMPKGEVVIVRV
jgi:hypothetical protein